MWSIGISTLLEIQPSYCSEVVRDASSPYKFQPFLRFNIINALKRALETGDFISTLLEIQQYVVLADETGFSLYRIFQPFLRFNVDS